MSRCRAPQPEQPLDHRALVGAPHEVDVQPGPVDLRVGDALEAQVEHGPALDDEARLEAVGLVGQALTADHRLPEPSQPLRLAGVEHQVLQVHGRTVGAHGGTSSLSCSGRCRRRTRTWE
jgi:hypothetical protein